MPVRSIFWRKYIDYAKYTEKDRKNTDEHRSGSHVLGLRTQNQERAAIVFFGTLKTGRKVYCNLKLLGSLSKSSPRRMLPFLNDQVARIIDAGSVKDMALGVLE